MSTSRSLVRTMTAAACLVASFAAAHAIAQTGPYGTAPGYASYPYPTTAYQAPGGYGMNSAAGGYYVAPRVARITPEQVAPPSLEANTTTMPYPAPYNNANASQPVGNGGAVPGSCSNCATGSTGYGAQCASGCDTGASGGRLGYGVGSLFGTGGGSGWGNGASIGDRLGSGYGDDCGDFCETAGRRRQWFGGIYGLYMKRDHDNEIWTSWDGANVASAVLGSHDAGFNWQSGNEIRFGSTFARASMAWEVVFWGLYSDTDYAEVNASATVGSLNSSIDFGGLEYNNGTGWAPVNDFFDDAQNHRVGSFYEVQNIEINLIKFPIASSVGLYGANSGSGSGAYASPVGGFGGQYFGGMYGTPASCGPRFTMVGIAGIRYMRTSEWFDFDTDDTDTIWGNSSDELYYDVDVENQLIGFQIGGAANYLLTQRLSFYCDTKFGIYGNRIKHRSLIWGDGGFARVVAGLPYAGDNFDVSSTKNDVAFLGELRLGGSFAVQRCVGSPTWRFFGGYRAIGITGVALAVNQLPANFSDTRGVANIRSNGSTILHGLEAGVEMTY